MGLLLAGALGGFGGALSAQGKQQAEAEALAATEKRKLILQEYLEGRKDARDEAKLASAERIADLKAETEQKKIDAKEASDDKRYGLLLRKMQETSARANSPTATSTDKQEAADAKMRLAEVEAGVTPQEMSTLLDTQKNNQFMTREAAEDAMRAAEAKQGNVEPELRGRLDENSLPEFLDRNKSTIKRGLMAQAGEKAKTTEPQDNIGSQRLALKDGAEALKNRMSTMKRGSPEYLDAERKLNAIYDKIINLGEGTVKQSQSQIPPNLNPNAAMSAMGY